MIIKLLFGRDLEPGCKWTPGSGWEESIFQICIEINIQMSVLN